MKRRRMRRYHVDKQLNGGHLRCLSGLVRAGESHDDEDPGRTLLIAARATSAELELIERLSAVARARDVGNTKASI